MKAYCYNVEMEYTGETVCQLDPVHSEREGRDVFLLPASSTWTPPPAYDPDTQKVIYDYISDSWTAVDLPHEVIPPEPAEPPEKTYTADDLLSVLLS